MEHFSFHLNVVWVVGIKDTKRKCISLPERSVLDFAELGWITSLVWAAKWLELLILFAPFLGRNVEVISIKI